VLDVPDDGLAIQYDVEEAREFTWHALMTIGTRDKPPSPS